MGIRRSLGIALAIVLLAGGCGSSTETTAADPEPEDNADAAADADLDADVDADADADAGGEVEPDPEPTETEPPTTTTTAAPPPDPAQILADAGVPLKDGMRLTSIADNDDGSVTIGAWVDAPPPPAYAADLANEGWDIIDVRFGSETTIGLSSTQKWCVVLYANYMSPDDLEYWIWAFVTEAPDGMTREECLEFGELYYALAAEFDLPPLEVKASEG